MARADGSHSAGGSSQKIFRRVCASRALVASIMCLHVAPTFQSSTHLPPPPPGCAGLEAGAGVFARGPMRLRGGKSGGLKAREMWAKPLEDLGQMEEELRMELMSLRVAKQVGGQPGRVNQIRNVRKSIARVLTVQTAKRRADAYELIKKDKYKPLDARPNRNMPKAMRQRLNKYERTRMSNKALRCLRLKIWGAGVRPMRRVILTSPLDPVFVGVCSPDEERTFEKYPKRKRGQFGKATSTGHEPPHAQMAREKHANRRKREQQRRQAFKAKYAND